MTVMVVRRRHGRMATSRRSLPRSSTHSVRLRSADVAAWAIPRDWTGETVAVLAAGPSMSAEVCAGLRGRCHTIAVNNVAIDTVNSETGQVIPALAPWADVLFAVGREVVAAVREPRRRAFAGLKLTGSNDLRWPEVKRLQFSPRAPFDERPTHVVMGGNSRLPGRAHRGALWRLSYLVIRL